MIDHVAIIKPEESKCTVEWGFLFEIKDRFVKVSSLENIHHGKVDVEPKEDEKVDWQLDVDNC
jgi:hypothetical protein